MTIGENTRVQGAPAQKPPPDASEVGQQTAADTGDGGGAADAAPVEQATGGAHQLQRFSQKVAQKIPSDPDPDDPVSP